MPWNNNSGGGGWKGGPWGSGPQQRGPQSPDLEEILRRGQDRLRNVLPSGGRGNPLIIIGIIVVLVVFWLLQAVYTVQPDELGQELVFGEPKDEVSTPGLHFHFWPVETVEKVNISQQREFIGVENNRRSTEEANLILSGDQNVVEVDFSVIWRVVDPKLFLFNVSAPEEFVRRISESAIREYIGRTNADYVRTEGRAEVEEAVRNILQMTLDQYQAGINIVSVQLEQADPPAEVADAFEEVQRAQQDLDRFQREAEQYANRRLGEARGEAAQVREAAEGYRERVVAEAQGEAQRFTSVLEEYSQAPDVTRRRLYLETMERVLQQSPKVIMESGTASEVVPFLPLTEIQRQAAPRPVPPEPPVTTPSLQQPQGGSQ